MKFKSKYCGFLNQYLNMVTGRWIVAVGSCHPLFVKKGYRQPQIVRARVVMAEHLGRKLPSSELVHHKDNNRQNDAIENLELTTAKIHCIIHMQGTQVKWTTKRRIAWSKRASKENYFERFYTSNS